ncbi:hypothetical protein HY379_02470 [Candidatus Saccharibacteria bacterium]|nr:hypothetical protein [Candidatus Saccharibacteria bacterium]
MRLNNVLKGGSVSVAVLILAVVSPTSTVLAQEATPTEVAPAESTEQIPVAEPSPEGTVTAPAQDQTTTTTIENIRGPSEPNGVDANTYTYNSETGMWENEYYIWDPVTKQTKPKSPQTYSYNPETGMWDTTEWRYNPTTDKYEPNTLSVSTASLPEGQVPNSGGLYDLFYDATISNNILLDSSSGNATVASNTTAGSALSGDAAALLNLINLLGGSTGLVQGGNFSVFNSNIYGNVQGDLMIDPGQILANSSTAQNVTVNSQDSGSIDNNITLAAQSGDATVVTNTSAGDATTGTAATVANIVNMINSIIGSGQSFLGTINIYGSLNGDILLPPDLLQTLLSSNGGVTASTSGPNSGTDVSSDTNTLANLTTNQAINNQLNLEATSGAAAVTNNTTAGSATTGSAQTSLTILNLTGNQIVGKDVLLVFINVMGQWVGVLFSAPSGSTAAAIGGGITQNTTLTDNTNVDSTTNQTINNTLNLTSVSGDATVADNTTAGGATSGDAMAAANLLNILNSTFSLADWFGILFINVFGSWNGSFGIDTAAGNPPAIGSAASQTATGDGPIKGVRVFRFVPSSASDDGSQFQLASATAASQDDPGAGSSAGLFPVLANTTGSGNGSSSGFNLLLPVVGSLVGLSLLGAERLMKKREESMSLRNLSRIVFRGKL